MTHKAHVVHHIQGKRIRVRVPTKRHDAKYFAAVQERLQSIAGVDAQVDPRAASVLVHYTGPIPALAESFVEAGLTDLLDIELGPLAEVTKVFPVPIKLIVMIGMAAWGGYNWFIE
jgi:hypothetical protein